ncbi:MAG: amidohydrolase family protein, partial [Caulobacteraceae bacterium]|nr:amidohydrolase family protein [Caulobacteraceae bacterium]
FCIHIGSVTSIINTSRDAPVHVAACISRMIDPALCVFDWLYSGHLQRFPNLKVLLSEGGVSWIPAALENADYQVRRHGAHIKKAGDFDVSLQGGFSVPVASTQRTRASSVDWVEGAMPSDLFRRQIFGCYFRNEPGLAHLDEIGVDNVMIEVDFPHSDSTWPHTIQMAEESLGDKPEEVQDKVLFGNAVRVFNLDLPAPPVMQQ